MFRKLSVWIFASVMATALALGGAAEALYRKSNTLSDVCFVHNSNNAPVLAIISVFPSGTPFIEIDTLQFPVLLGAFGDARVFSWTPLLPGSELCQVMLVR